MTLSESAWALFEAHRAGKSPLSRSAGSFLGQCAVDPPSALTERQARWLGKLLDRAGLPQIGETANV